MMGTSKPHPFLSEQISQFRNARSPEHPQTRHVSDVLEDIYSGVYRVAVEKCREHLRAGRKTLAEAVKKSLPAVTWAGTFRRRANSELIAPTSLMPFDIDGDTSLVGVKTAMIDDPFVAFAFFSPSRGECGLKGAILLGTCWSNSHEFKALFAGVTAYIRGRYGVTIDQARSDVAGLCFVSYDEEVAINEAAIPLVITLPPPPPQPQPVTQPAQARRIGSGDVNWLRAELAHDLASVERMLSNAIPGDAERGRHTAYLQAGRICKSILTGYGKDLTTADALIDRLCRVREDVRDLDRRALVDMMERGTLPPKTAELVLMRRDAKRAAWAAQQQQGGR